jgi:hypothetical protein
VFLAAAPACTGFEPGSDVLGETVGSNLPPGEDWTCLDGTELREEPAMIAFASDATRVVYSARMLDLSTGAVYEDMTVRGCGISDPECDNPVTDDVPVDAAGWFDLPLFQGFDGFLEFRSEAALPSLYFLSEPIERPTRVEYPFGAVSIESVPALVRFGGFQQDPGAGLVALRARDCTNTTAPGVSFEIEGEGSAFYFIGGIPTDTATATDTAGLGGFGAVPPGYALISATNANDESIMPPRSVQIRGGWLTTLYARPPKRLLYQSE